MPYDPDMTAGVLSPEVLDANAALAPEATTSGGWAATVGTIIGLLGVATPVAGNVVGVVQQATNPQQTAAIQQQTAQTNASIAQAEKKQDYIMYGLLGFIFLIIIVTVIIVNKKS